MIGEPLYREIQDIHARLELSRIPRYSSDSGKKSLVECLFREIGNRLVVAGERDYYQFTRDALRRITRDNFFRNRTCEL